MDRSGQGKGPKGGKRRDVHERALGLLAVRQRSRRELERRLVQAGFEPEAVDAELARLEAVGLVDDGAFARAVVESRMGRRGESRRAVAGKLALAGVDRELATAVLDEHGRVTARLAPLTTGILEAEVEGRRGSTPYARWLAACGLGPLWLLAVGGLGLAGWRRGRDGRAP